MSNKKLIDLSTSSGFELRAEIAKQEEKFKQRRNLGLGPEAKPNKKSLDKSKFDKTNVGVESRKKRDEQTKEDLPDDQERLKLSELKLKHKAKIYDQLIREGKELDEGEIGLIDFEKKNWVQEEEEPKADMGNDQDDWVEYTDGFGRNRLIKRNEFEKKIESSKIEGLELVSGDMLREMERQKWEQEREAEMANDYNHFDAGKEYRTMGTGFYKLSKDEEERSAQLEELKRLRNETERIRSLHKSIHQKRQIKIQDRLAKIQQLRQMKVASQLKSDNSDKTSLNKLAISKLLEQL